MLDVVYCFMLYINQQPLNNQPRLSFETSVVREVWTPHFTNHPLAGTVVGNVFIGPVAGAIYISEELPALGNANVLMPLVYPSTQGNPMYLHRITRASLHIIPLLLIMWFLFASGISALSPFFGPMSDDRL